MKLQTWIPLLKFLLKLDSSRRRLRLRRRAKLLFLSSRWTSAAATTSRFTNQPQGRLSQIRRTATRYQQNPFLLRLQILPRKADPLIGRQPLPKAFLLSVTKRLREAARFDEPPDLPCARAIAGCFRGKGSLLLVDWLCSAAERDLGRKTKAQGLFRYGLFLRDAETCAAAGKFPLSKTAQFQVSLQEAVAARARANLA